MIVGVTDEVEAHRLQIRSEFRKANVISSAVFGLRTTFERSDIEDVRPIGLSSWDILCALFAYLANQHRALIVDPAKLDGFLVARKLRDHDLNSNARTTTATLRQIKTEGLHNFAERF